jgi:hypothetical protein
MIILLGWGALKYSSPHQHALRAVAAIARVDARADTFVWFACGPLREERSHMSNAMSAVATTKEKREANSL